jgi:predicted nucleic acid-binding protein
VIEQVVDASVLVKWFRRGGETHVQAALTLRRRFEAGELLLIVPPLLFLEVLNAAARRWGFTPPRLAQLARDLDRIGLEIAQPSLGGVAHWAGSGLTAYDACYVALADQRGCALVTDDRRILTLAAPIAQTLDRASS